jgi:pyruvate/2-oxoglutarate dehydrogenase complex dihydrolipoamide dehydrogenase (E3) component
MLGGDCLNVGCVPSKAMLRAARAAHEIRNGEFAVTLAGAAKTNFSGVMERMRRLRAGISKHDSVERFAALGVDVFIGQGRFVERSVIEVDGRQLKFDRAVIATGARAVVPRIAGLREIGFYTNETIFNLTALPRRLAVIGAGPLGCELAQCFARLGSEVILITDGARILPREDADAADLVRRQMETDGARIVTGATVQRAEIKKDSKALALLIGDRSSEVLCDAILVAVGRRPNLENLGLETAGIRYSGNGIEVDERLRTSNPRVFAAGDVCSRFKFTHAADAMARIVIANALFYARRKVTGLVIPWCTYTDPEIAHVGFYEKDARAAGFAVATLTQGMSGVDRAILDGETAGFARVHYDKKSGRILGGTIVARHAGEMLGELTLAMVAGQKLDVLSSTIHSYPTQAEALRKLGDAYMKTKLTPAVKKIFAGWLAWRR